MSAFSQPMESETLRLIRDALERRGWANASYWALLLQKPRGLEQASQMFTLILADVLEEATVTAHNNKIRCGSMFK
jgi:hypothetical protein